MKAITRWYFAPAAWWQFWMPQSGGLGGAIFALFLSAVLRWLGVF